ncbi:MAG: hypothetical protein GXP54_09425 [Deltaproteobacteria bacterium]|nr:hypothetical protein [Deltaproteobacteria bacterium]
MCDSIEGVCYHVKKTCDDLNLCTQDDCNPETGECEFIPKDCSDSDPCTVDVCASPDFGTCTHDPKDCNDNDPCTADSCDPTDGACVHTPIDCNGTTYTGIACGFDTITVISIDATTAVVILKDNPDPLTFTYGTPSLYAGYPHPPIPEMVYEAPHVNVVFSSPPDLTMDLQIDPNTVVMWAGDTSTGWLGCSGEFTKQ